MKYFVITKNGIGRIMEAADSVSDPMGEIAKWHPADQAQVTTARRISKSAIPADYAYRDAWRDTGSAIEIDMPEARAVHRRIYPDLATDPRVDAATTIAQLKAVRP